MNTRSYPTTPARWSASRKAFFWLGLFAEAIGCGLLARYFAKLVFGTSADATAPLVSGAVVGIAMVVLMAVAGSRLQAAEFNHSRRVFGWAMKRTIEREGRAGNKLVGIGMFRVFFLKTATDWEYRRVNVARAVKIDALVSEGWELVSKVGVAPLETAHFVRPMRGAHTADSVIG